jgi:hypothetical protein
VVWILAANSAAYSCSGSARGSHCGRQVGAESAVNGAAVHDTATVTGNQTADTPGGTVIFFVCGPIPTGSCDGSTNVGTSIGTGTLSGSGATASADSPDVNTSASPLAPGRYCFRATWPGDTNYPGTLTEFGGATGTNECFTIQKIQTTTTTTPSTGSGGTTTFGSSVTDHAVVQATTSGDGTPTGTVTVTDTTAATSAQTWLPNDTATVAPASGAPLNGTLSAQLYTGDNCGATSGSVVSGQLYTKTLTNATSAADRTLTTGNATFTVSTSTSASWLVTFTSTDPNVGGSSHCESTSLTINN